MSRLHASCLKCDWKAHHDEYDVLKEAASMHNSIPGHRAGPEPCKCDEDE